MPEKAIAMIRRMDGVFGKIVTLKTI